MFFMYLIKKLHTEKDALLRQLKQNPFEFTTSVKDYETAMTRKGEIRWQGRMYDIAKTVVYGDSIKIFCLRDNEEEALIDQLGAFLHDNTRTPKGLLLFEWIKMICLPFVVPDGKLVFDLDKAIRSLVSLPEYAAKVTISHLAKDFPPPRSPLPSSFF